MRQNLRLGQIAGIPVGMHWSVLLILLLLTQGVAGALLPAAAAGYAAAAYWLVAVALAGLFLAALLGHELAHALTARHFGVRVKAITLWLLGGVSELDGNPPHPRADLLIALAGPLASLAASGLFAGAAWLAALAGLAPLRVGLVWLAAVNAVTAVFNLLPGAPLDGGRVVAALVWWRRGDRAAARRAAARAGQVTGGLVAGGGLAAVLVSGSLSGLWLMLLGWFLATAAGAEAADVRLSTGLAGIDVARVMTAPPVCGYAGQSIAAFVSTVAATSPHRAYPVVGLDGALAGLVTLSRLATVPGPARATTRLTDVRVPLARVRVIAPDTPLLGALGVLGDPYRLAVVTVGGRPCGVLSPGDVRRALDVAELGGVPDRSRGAEIL
ncbi:site-2 protease family protein [Krasilnikovia sp. MM14-A1004]|uniref:site-2 protease family protein n=1 Tax=Krasilnikovia sp. MM14-A1004 TaxID=3373541 RepID=UPI00399CDB2F